MKRFVGAAAIAVVAVAAQSQAAVVSYPSLDQSYSYPASPGTDINNSTGAVALDSSSGVFTNNGGGSPTPADTRYYGGTFHYTPCSADAGQAAWGGSVTYTFKTGVDNETLLVGKPGGQNNWVMVGRGNSVLNSGTVASGDMPFVIKVETFGGWNIVHASLFMGDSATAATEGTPLGTLELVSNNPLTTATLDSSGAGWAPQASQAATTGFFSSTTWNPVAVPEPGALALLGVAALGLFRRRNA